MMRYKKDKEYEDITEKRFADLERGIKVKPVSVPDAAPAPGRSGFGGVLKTVASAAAAILIIGGVYVGILLANRHDPAPASPETESTEPEPAGDFPYDVQDLTENERASVDRLLYEIEYDLFQNGGLMLEGLTDSAAAYGLKIVKPLKERIDTFRELDGPSAEDGRRLDVAYADVLRLIIKQSGEDGFIDGVREKFENNNELPEGWTFDKAYALLGMKELADQIYEAKILTAEQYAEKIGAVSTSDRVEFSWRYTKNDGEIGYFSPRALFGAKYPACLYIYDVFYEIENYHNIEETVGDDEARRELKDSMMRKCDEMQATESEREEIAELCDKLPISDLMAFNSEFGQLKDRKGDFKAIIKKYSRIVFKAEQTAETEPKTLKDEQIDMITDLCRENNVDPDTVLGLAYELPDEYVDEFISGLEIVIGYKADLKIFIKQWTKKLSDPSVIVAVPDITKRDPKDTQEPVETEDPYDWFTPSEIFPLYEKAEVLTAKNYPPLKLSKTVLHTPADPDVTVSRHVETLIKNGVPSLEDAGLGYAVCIVRATGTDPFYHEQSKGYYLPCFSFEILRILKSYGSERTLIEGAAFKAAIPYYITNEDEGGKTLYYAAGTLPVTEGNALYLVLLCASDRGSQEEDPFGYLSPDGISVSEVYSPGLPSPRVSLDDLENQLDSIYYPSDNRAQLKKIINSYLQSAKSR